MSLDNSVNSPECFVAFEATIFKKKVEKMKKGKRSFTKAAAIVLMSAVTLTSAQVPAFAYGEYNVGSSTFKEDTDNSDDFKNWLANEWAVLRFCQPLQR